MSSRNTAPYIIDCAQLKCTKGGGYNRDSELHLSAGRLQNGYQLICSGPRLRQYGRNTVLPPASTGTCVPTEGGKCRQAEPSDLCERQNGIHRCATQVNGCTFESGYWVIGTSLVHSLQASYAGITSLFKQFIFMKGSNKSTLSGFLLQPL